MKGMEIVADFYQMVLGSTDVILGFKWLATLGETLINWGQLSLQVTVDGRLVKLQGDPSLYHTQMSLNSLQRVVKRGVQGLYSKVY